VLTTQHVLCFDEAMNDLTRTNRLRTALGESQMDFSKRLGVSQTTVWRLELGQPETGPISLLLDAIERELAAGLPVASPADGPSQPPSPGTGAAAPALSRDAAAPFSHEVHDVRG
jgi:transcriptional regulator with XRE-family HTH domain